MNTSVNNLLRRPVGQLDKNPIFLLKTNEKEALRVGRHKKESSHTSARTHKGVPAHDLKVQTFDLQAMNYLNTLFASLQPDLKVVFHNVLYVEQIQEGFLPDESDIFLQFVKSFAQFRFHSQSQAQGVILTNDNDFYLALKLMQKRKLSDYSDIKPKNRNKILDLLKLKFQKRTFTPKIIAQELFYNYAFIHRILALLILEKEVEFLKQVGEEKVFRLREKSLVHVTGN